MNIKRKIRKLRENKGLTLQQLADKLEVSKTLVWKYENTDILPSAEMIKRIAIYFDVTADFLIFDEKERPGMFKAADKKLLKKLEAVLTMEPEDREYIVRSIDMILGRK